MTFLFKKKVCLFRTQEDLEVQELDITNQCKTYDRIAAEHLKKAENAVIDVNLEPGSLREIVAELVKATNRAENYKAILKDVRRMIAAVKQEIRRQELEEATGARISGAQKKETISRFNSEMEPRVFDFSDADPPAIQVDKKVEALQQTIYKRFQMPAFDLAPSSDFFPSPRK